MNVSPQPFSKQRAAAILTILKLSQSFPLAWTRRFLELVGLTEISCAARDAVVAVDDLGALIADKESFGVELGESAVVVTQVLGQLQEVTNKVFKMRYEKEEALKRQLQEATASASTEQCGN